MTTLQALRKQQQLVTIEDKAKEAATKPVYDMDQVRANVDAAYKNLVNHVSKRSKESNYERIKIGNRRSNLKDLDIIFDAYKSAITSLGYEGQIVAEKDSFSNVGDPYYMGEPDDVISYFVKISEA